jgi:hypothetical protein
MKTSTHPDTRFDQIDVEQFEAMAASKAFKRYSDRLREMEARYVRGCINESDVTQLHRWQGAVEAMRVALDLPAAILGQLKKGRTKAE